MRLCDWQGTQMFMKPSNHSSFFPAHLPSDFVCTMAKTKDLAAVKRSLRVARAGFNKAAGDLEAIIKRRVPKCKKRLRAVRQMEERVKELGGELSDEVSSRSSLLGSDSSDNSSDSSESEAQAPMEKAEAKPVAAKKGKSEKGDGKVVRGPASKKPPRRSKKDFRSYRRGRMRRTTEGNRTPKACGIQVFIKGTRSTVKLAKSRGEGSSERENPISMDASGDRAGEPTHPAEKQLWRFCLEVKSPYVESL